MEGRYSLQQMISYIAKEKLEQWQEITRSDSLEALRAFMGHNYRIIDLDTGREIERS